MTRVQHALILLGAVAIASVLFGFGLAAANAPTWAFSAVELLCVVAVVGRLVTADGARTAAVRGRGNRASTAL
jgi:membrane protein YdbS with pleckstrin-like domain